jgi:hypothetical protein
VEGIRLIIFTNEGDQPVKTTVKLQKHALLYALEGTDKNKLDIEKNFVSLGKLNNFGDIMQASHYYI